MDNQHKIIKGYRDLNAEEVELINKIRELGAELDRMLDGIYDQIDHSLEEHGSPDAESRRWLAISKTHLQQGLMAATRAVARPQQF